jgi:hypothetical protein
MDCYFFCLLTAFPMVPALYYLMAAQRMAHSSCYWWLSEGLVYRIAWWQLNGLCFLSLVDSFSNYLCAKLLVSGIAYRSFFPLLAAFCGVGI